MLSVECFHRWSSAYCYMEYCFKRILLNIRRVLPTVLYLAVLISVYVLDKNCHNRFPLF